MQLDLSLFNEEQKKAVLHVNGPAAVIASPGSGKTRVITYRIMNLLNEGVRPNRIWACTFTKKSSLELKERLHGLYGDEAEDLNITTLHSTCYAILKKFENRGYRKIKILRGLDAWMFFDKKLKVDPKAYQIRDIKTILGTIAYMKLDLVRVQDLREKIKDKLDDTRLSVRNDADLCIYDFYKQYELWMKENDTVDFSDMLMKTYYHLANPDNVERTNSILNHIDYLLVDEAQDANRASYELYKILGSKTNNIMMCGDPKQAIYGFQGSNYNYLYDFVKTFEARLIELPLNYRSTQTIIKHSNDLIQKDAFFSNSTTVTNNGTGEAVKTFTAENEYHEAQNIREAVDHLRSTGYEYKDIAVLYRVNAQSIPICDEFTTNGIPFVVHVKNSFYKRKEVRQIVTYIKLINDLNSGTFEDFKLIANAPTRFIKGSTLEALEDIDEDSFWLGMVANVGQVSDWGQKKNIQKFMDELIDAHTACHGMETYGIADYVLRKLGYEEWLKSEQSANDDVEKTGDEDKSLNVEILFSSCKSKTDPVEFVKFAEQEANAGDPTVPKEGVHLMTMHSSKGLEFPAVIIAGVCTRLMPYYRAEDMESYKEERRVAYVGVTRAKKKLMLSIINGKYGRFKVEPSGYLYDMGLTVPSMSCGVFRE